MNFNKFINSDYLKNNPLCGISTYKDELNLATGACTRQIKKLVFNGTEEGWEKSATRAGCFALRGIGTGVTEKTMYCTHATYVSTASQLTSNNTCYMGNDFNIWLDLFDAQTTNEQFKAYLAQQYANGTPVCVWYVLATPTTEIITVPSGLSGTEEGYLNQSGTPTPTNPIYPTANTVEKWFDINHYIMETSTDTITTLPADIYANDAAATVGLKGNMSQSGTPTPTSPIQPQECGELETTGEHAGQYKIPILSGNTTTPVYLGEVETTRKVKKLVLTGEEDWTIEHTDNFYMNDVITDAMNTKTVVCSHQASVQAFYTAGLENIWISASGRLNFTTTLVSHTATDFKVYLAQQYAAGTPVVVYYILENEISGIVNEPIRKIGDYADEVSNVSIPVAAGGDTLSVGTTVQPSEVTVNYKGWHPAAVHEHTNGAWT